NSGARHARIKISVCGTPPKNCDIRSRDDRLGCPHSCRFGPLGKSGISLLETWTATGSDFPSRHPRSFAGHARIPDILLHVADGKGQTRHLEIAAVNPRVACSRYRKETPTSASKIGDSMDEDGATDWYFVSWI